MPEPSDPAKKAASKRYVVTLADGYLTLDAESEDDARAEALQALVESPDLLVVTKAGELA